MQIGNAITEKMVLDVIVQARDRGLFRAITDCGAGGFSSAVGEMGADLGAEVELCRGAAQVRGALVYRDLDLARPRSGWCWPSPMRSGPSWRSSAAARASRPPTWAGSSPAGGSTLRYQGELVADLSMDFLHEGRPTVVREATWTDPAPRPLSPAVEPRLHRPTCSVLGHWDVCSKEWIVRQYDHEVQARTVVKPLVGVERRRAGRRGGRPAGARLDPRPGRSAAGINPRYGQLDPYAMAGCVIDEAIRNCRPSGPTRPAIALLDNFCWGNTERPETLGSLVRAAEACRDVALAYGRRSSRARTVSTTNTRTRAGAWRSRRRS